jgi:hypothetical protein
VDRSASRKFYLYPMELFDHRIKWDYDRFFAARWIGEARDALSSHPDRTEDPAEASAFVVPSTLVCLSFVSFRKRAVNRMLGKLPFWNTGKPHLVFDLGDSPMPIYEKPYLENLVVLKSAFHESYYRRGIDISIPQFPRYLFSQATLPVGARKNIVGFKAHPRAGLNPVRKVLFEFNDPDRGMVLLPGAGAKFEFSIRGGEIRYELSEDPLSYTHILLNSKLAVLARGNGYALSYRMIESMNAGAIPVIVSDGYVLPFSELIDYELFSYRIEEGSIGRFADRIDEIAKDHALLERKQEQVKKHYLEYFRDTGVIVDRIIDIWRSRG